MKSSPAAQTGPPQAHPQRTHLADQEAVTGPAYIKLCSALWPWQGVSTPRTEKENEGKKPMPREDLGSCPCSLKQPNRQVDLIPGRAYPPRVSGRPGGQPRKRQAAAGGAPSPSPPACCAVNTKGNGTQGGCWRRRSSVRRPPEALLRMRRASLALRPSALRHPLKAKNKTPSSRSFRCGRGRHNRGSGAGTNGKRADASPSLGKRGWRRLNSVLSLGERRHPSWPCRASAIGRDPSGASLCA